MTTFTVVTASTADMENLTDYTVTVEAEGFTSREAAEAHAEQLEDAEGGSYHFWVLTAAELAAIA